MREDEQQIGVLVGRIASIGGVAQRTVSGHGVRDADDDEQRHLVDEDVQERPRRKVSCPTEPGAAVVEPWTPSKAHATQRWDEDDGLRDDAEQRADAKQRSLDDVIWSGSGARVGNPTA